MSIYDEIQAERKRQDQLWGGPAHDDAHDWWNWADYIKQRVDKLKATHEPSFVRRRELFLHIAALAVAAMEAQDRTGG